MEDVIKVYGLGGFDEVGKCLLCLDINEEIFIIEAGMKYPDSTNPGIDAIIPNFEYLKMHKERVKAYIITHGHDDQIGALAYMYKDVPAPIYGSEATIAFIKYYAKGHPSLPLMKFEMIKPSSEVLISGRKFSFFQTVHSIMNSSGFSVETSQGNIVYTGDFMVEYSSSNKYRHDINTIARIAEKNTLLLLAESMGAEKPGYTSPSNRLTNHLVAPFQEALGRIFIALYSQSVYNFDEVINYAVERNKKVTFYDADTEEYISVLQSFGGIKIPKEVLVARENHLRVPPQDLIVILLGNGSKIYNKIGELASRTGDDKTFILNETDTFIIACPPAPAFEVLATYAIDDLYRSNAKVVNITRKQISSMHAQEEDLKTMLSIIRPKYYLPVKGEYVQLMANARLATTMGLNLNHNNIFLLDNGLVVRFIAGKAQVLYDEKEHIPTGDVLIDGLGVGDVRKDVVKERQYLADEGIVILGATLSKTEKKVIAGPDIQVKGFVFSKESENTIKKELMVIFKQALGEFLAGSYSSMKQFNEEVGEKVTRLFRRTFNKRPVVLPEIIFI